MRLQRERGRERERESEREREREREREASERSVSGERRAQIIMALSLPFDGTHPHVMADVRTSIRS